MTELVTAVIAANLAFVMGAWWGNRQAQQRCGTGECECNCDLCVAVNALSQVEPHG